ncbi:uncharacterized protein Z518_08932 [Rhinocladiella mackenziei CBS 650.93]|uniref:Methyltransferase n=1 Tax=Rhinocladiella mackenziei CBS 650.93 TaxID=1442369 RepID=A0A0D2FGR6_9EURO|nr:uncharacterized protein Z518_08932 [Rhinocladiella mackenziei CBS 650.93]KIX01207.1 hypothetical protein Z518_08932 [Rhinocladiella mackenziei CBS 650.93]
MGSISQSTRAELHFLDPAVHATPEAEKLYFVSGRPTPGKPQTNQVFIPRTVEIHNARFDRDSFNLKEHSFEWAYVPINNHDLSTATGREEYLRYTEDFLKKHLGASRVHAYDHVLREQRDPGMPRTDGFEKSKRTVLTTHCDISQTCAQNRVKEYFPDPEEENLYQGRWQIVNVWRPLVDVVESHPLAVCDAKTVCREDLTPSDMIYPTHTTEIYHLFHNPGQKWYYLDAQTKDEVLLLKNFDSDLSTACAHTAFVDPATPPTAKGRKSVEVRCWVFYAD